MRLGGLFLLLILSYFFNPIEPIVEDPPVMEITDNDSIPSEDLDASIIDPVDLEQCV